MKNENGIKKIVYKTVREYMELAIIDHNIFLFMALYIPVKAITPYVSLFFLSNAMDDLQNHNQNTAIINIFLMILFATLFAVAESLCRSIDEYKMIGIDINFRTLLRKKILEDNEMKSQLQLNELKSNERLAISNGGLDKIYDSLFIEFSSILSMLIATIIIIDKCFIKNLKNNYRENLLIIVFIGLWYILFKLTNWVSEKYEEKISSILAKTDKLNRQICYYMEYMFVDPNIGRDVRIFNFKSLVLNKYHAWETGTIDFLKKVNIQEKNKKICVEIINGIFLLLTYLLFAYKICTSKMTIGMMSMCIGSILLFNRSIQEFSAIKASIKTTKGYLKPLLKIIKSNIVALDNSVEQCDIQPLIIEFKHVYFKYNDSENFVLEDINYSFSSDEKIAIVGKNGAGKTTLVKLLCRIIKPTSGEILLNGKNIYEYSESEYLKYFSVVFQDYSLFDLTLGENIFADNNFNTELGKKIGDNLGISELLNQNIDKRLSYSDDNGVKFSGGEMQKIAIARAMNKQGSLFIMDEPTSSLDPKSEMEIYKRIDEIASGRGCIFISHRMSSCKFCDNILVVDNKKISEKGCHGELISLKGVYYELWQAQSRKYTDIA